tara:strand:- start:1000 stop:1236 length:237 start_codon:yes stop_codon:yes gene_type:complete
MRWSVKVGDLVKRAASGDPQEIADDKELGIGMIVGLDHIVIANSNPPSPLDLKYIVMWGKYGIGWEMPLRLEVVNESR